MEIRNAKLIVNTSGGTASESAKTFRVTLPNNWIEKMNLGADNRDIELRFDGETISVIKKQNFEDFLSTRKGNKLFKLEYFNFNDLSTTIIADYSKNEIAVKNSCDNSLYLAFGKNESPSWEDYTAFLESRCISKNRDRLRDYLNTIGLDYYEPLEIIKITKGKMAEDNQWIKVTEL